MRDSRDPTKPDGPANPIDAIPAKTPFEEPRLVFVEPRLTPRGDLREVTGFFGGFSP